MLIAITEVAERVSAITRQIPTILRQNLILFTALVVGLSSSAWGAPVDFVRDVRPILEKHCYSCHGPEKQKSGLRLDIKSEAFKGGELYGASIVPHSAKESPLVQFSGQEDADLRMPPEGPPLPAAEIAVLAKWVDEGAAWPEGVDSAELPDKRDHWSFKPLQSPTVPATRNKFWPRNELDCFILAAMEQEDLKPAPESTRATWLRRVSLDLTGLPPSPQQLAAFVEDERPDAYERIVDELLSSPRYGERWAQHWLDVVRYADTHGFEVNTERPHAWPYRDYVIEAFNNDTPYDRFIRAQVCGDALGQDAATGFLITASVLLPGQIGQDPPSMRLARQDSLDEIVANVSQTFLGLSIGCARCHDHKFDPISQQDYYSMQAFVAGVEYADRQLYDSTQESELAQLRQQLHQVDVQLTQYLPLARSGQQRSLVNARVNTDRFEPVKAKYLRFSVLSTNNLEPCLDEIEVFDIAGSNVAAATAGTSVTSSGDTTAADRHELRFVNDGNYGNSRSWMSSESGRGWIVLEFAEETTIERVDWGRDREGKFSDRLAIDYRIEVSADGAAETWQTVADATDRAAYRASDQPQSSLRAEVSAEVADEAVALFEQKQQLTEKISARAKPKLAFAGMFRDPDIIHVLRRGDPEQPLDEIVPAVPAALGSLSLPRDATDQQRRLALADWLASPDNPLTARVLVNRVWQGHFGVGLVDSPSDFGRTASAAAKDADARLLWRYPVRRSDGETIRDSMLAVSGRLNVTMGGPGFNLFDKRGGLEGFHPVESFSGDGLRRMIYAHKVRRERDSVFGAFDCPDGGQSTAQRRESTTPIQALNLLNSRFTIDQAAAFAERVQSEVGDDIIQQIHRAYGLALLREPTAAEVSEAEEAVKEFGLATLCRALFNSNEFIFLP